MVGSTTETSLQTPVGSIETSLQIPVGFSALQVLWCHEDTSAQPLNVRAALLVTADRKLEPPRYAPGSPGFSGLAWI